MTGENPTEPATAAANTGGAPADLTPEARRREAIARAESAGAESGEPRDLLRHRIRRRAGPGTRFFTVLMRVINGAWNDGFVHAGNLAYMTLISLFPFFIVLAATFSALGEQARLDSSIDAVLTAMPPRVADVIGPVAHDVAAARHGWLLWVGGIVGLWSASSLVETLRDILRRAYGTKATRAFWKSRAFSGAVIFGSVILLLLALSLQVTISALQEIILALFPQLEWVLSGIFITRLVSAAVLLATIYTVFRLLTPRRYQGRMYPKWPGPLLVTVWWIIVANALPRILHTFFAADLTYGSMAGVMIALFFFWLVGLGMVVGAELNAALAETPEERVMLGRGASSAEKTKILEQEDSE